MTTYARFFFIMTLSVLAAIWCSSHLAKHNGPSCILPSLPIYKSNIVVSSQGFNLNKPESDHFLFYKNNINILNVEKFDFLLAPPTGIDPDSSCIIKSTWKKTGIDYTKSTKQHELNPKKLRPLNISSEFENTPLQYPVRSTLLYYISLAIFIGLLLGLPAMQWMRTNLAHIENWDKIRFAPPCWLAVIIGWILGLSTGFLYYSLTLTYSIPLILALVIFICKNSKSKSKTTTVSTSNSKTIDTLNTLYEKNNAVSIEEIKLLYTSLKNWFIQENPIAIDTLHMDLLLISAEGEKIASDLITCITKNEHGLRIGIAGPYGCGKSSLINSILYYIDTQIANFTSIKPIVCRVNMWGCHTSASAEEHLLEEIVNEISYYFDCTPFVSISQEWKDLVNGTNAYSLNVFKLFWQEPTFNKKLKALAVLLKKLNYHLILVIEDIDRNNNKNYSAREIQSLLERLKTSVYNEGLDCSIILAGGPTTIIDEKSITIDYSRLCESLKTPPVISIYTLRKIIWAIARKHVPKAFNYWSAQQQYGWSLLYGNKESNNSVGSAAATTDIFSLLDFQRLINTPRNLKSFLRRLDKAWDTLEGEIHYFDLFLTTLLRTALPDSFDFIHSHHEILCSLSKIANCHEDLLSGEIPHLISQFSTHRTSLASVSTSFDKIIVLLFGQEVAKILKISTHLNIRTWPTSEVQNIKNGPFPTDYWNRIYSEGLPANEIKDVEIHSKHEKWLARPESEKGLIELLRKEEADAKWVGLKYHLTLDLLQTALLTKAIIQDRGHDTKGCPISVNFSSLASNTATSTLMVLQKRAQQLAPAKAQQFLDLLISIFKELCETNLLTAILFVQNWTKDRTWIYKIINQQINKLNKEISKTLQSKIKHTQTEAHTRLMNLIPENEPSTLCKYLSLLCMTNPDNNNPTELTNAQRDLLTPIWLSNTWYDAIVDPQTKQKALIQAIGALIDFDHPDLHLIEERIPNIFGNNRHKVIKAIAAMDFTNTVYESQSLKLKELARTWLAKTAYH